MASSERRYFVYRGTAHSATGAVPPLVHAIPTRIDSPFYSVDIAETPTGELRLIELGDGQVSDIKEWSAEEFVGMFVGRGQEIVT